MAMLTKLIFGRWKQEIVIVRSREQVGSSAVSHSGGLQKMCESHSPFCRRFPGTIPNLRAPETLTDAGTELSCHYSLGQRWFSGGILCVFSSSQ